MLFALVFCLPDFLVPLVTFLPQCGQIVPNAGRLCVSQGGLTGLWGAVGELLPHSAQVSEEVREDLVTVVPEFLGASLVAWVLQAATSLEAGYIGMRPGGTALLSPEAQLSPSLLCGTLLTLLLHFFISLPSLGFCGNCPNPGWVLSPQQMKSLELGSLSWISVVPMRCSKVMLIHYGGSWQSGKMDCPSGNKESRARRHNFPV